MGSIVNIALPLTLAVLALGVAPAARAEIACFLQAERLPPASDAPAPDTPAEVTFAARIDCADRALAPEDIDRPEGALDRLAFAATAAERVIIGASLTDEAPSREDWDADIEPDTDFPIRYVTIPPAGTSVDWTFSVEAEVAASYAHLIMRVWNTEALAECATGRDGCNRFGYVLLWEERRALDALELPLP